MKSIAVIGAGTMGNGIAHVFAQKGFIVHLIDTHTFALEKAIATIEKNIDRQITKGTITADSKSSTLSNITTYTDMALGIGDADLIIEAATESCEVKKSNKAVGNNCRR